MPKSFLKALVLIAVMLGMLALLGMVVGGGDGVLFALVLGSLLLILYPSVDPELIARFYRAQPLGKEEAPLLYGYLEELAKRSGLRAVPVLYLLPGTAMTAFTVGSPKKAAILIEATLLERLNLPETVAVMAHETAHIVNRDLWLMNLADIITRISALMSVMGQLMVLVFLPFYMLENIPVPWLGLIILLLAPVANALLQSSLSRIREFDADITAARLLGETPFLITALSKIDREERTLLRTLLFPGRNEKVPSLLRTHPPTQERISRLAALKLPDAFPPFAYSDYTPKKTPYQSTARHALIRYLTGQRH